MPHGAAKLAIGGAAESHLGLARDDLLDGRVFHGGQIRGSDFTTLAARASFLQERQGATSCLHGRRETGVRFGS